MNTAAIITKTAEQADNTAELMAEKPSLIGASLPELTDLMATMGLERFRAKQLWGWLYNKGVTDFSAMHTINKPTQQLLAQHVSIARAGVSKNAVSFDNTRKWLVKFADGREVETVYIPDAPRGTLCISSQVGCTLACTFCHTGTQNLVRNLTASEIITQVLMAKDDLHDWGSTSSAEATKTRSADRASPERRAGQDRMSSAEATKKLTNIVFMGMGEPLFNFEHVVRACNLLTDPDGLAFSKRKVTVSTSGVVPKIRELGERTGVNLAVSLHAVRDDLRNEIVPINRKYPIAELLDACRDYVKIVPSRRIMFEYVMLDGVNDSVEDARALVKLLKGIPSKVNLIPFNPWPGSPYTCSSNNRIHAFGRELIAAGIASPIRKTRGQDIMAACGQLKSASERKKGEKVKRV